MVNAELVIFSSLELALLSKKSVGMAQHPFFLSFLILRVRVTAVDFFSSGRLRVPPENQSFVQLTERTMVESFTL